MYMELKTGKGGGGEIKVEKIADNKVVIDLSIGRQTKYKYAYMSYIFGCIQL